MSHYNKRGTSTLEQYQATFGRQLLENFIQDVIPDREFSPGELHLRLLRLPWEDVLTTNYDTLLERAAERVIERRYDVVRTVADVPRAKPPRIVKLHGSFPSHRPFILTAMDFRTYPRAFAGFANLAQQTASENVLCLIGFSGDDPNFLEWTGGSETISEQTRLAFTFAGFWTPTNRSARCLTGVI